MVKLRSIVCVPFFVGLIAGCGTNGSDKDYSSADSSATAVYGDEIYGISATGDTVIFMSDSSDCLKMYFRFAHYNISGDLRDSVIEDIYNFNLLRKGSTIADAFSSTFSSTNDSVAHDNEEFSRDSEEINKCVSNLDVYPAFSYGDDYVTFAFINSYGCSMACHGLHSVRYCTYKKDSGKRLTWNDFDKGHAFHDVLLQSLMSYFEEKTIDGLMSHLDYDAVDCDSVPYPAYCLPAVVDDHILALYQQYEIACYAEGIPCASIPLDFAMQHLSSSGKAFFNK